jgi:hypothetical protein
MVGGWLIELIQKLASVGREAFDVPTLAFGVERVEGHAGFAAAGDAAEYDELAVGQVQVDLPQVVYGYSAQLDGTLAHDEGFRNYRWLGLVGLAELDPSCGSKSVASNPLS